MYIDIASTHEFESTIAKDAAVLAYFSTTECNVCKVLKPKIAEMILQEFPKVTLLYVDTNLVPGLAAQNRIFAVPTLVVYFEGREFFRKSRNFGLDELRRELRRPYDLMFI